MHRFPCERLQARKQRGVGVLVQAGTNRDRIELLFPDAFRVANAYGPAPAGIACDGFDRRRKMQVGMEFERITVPGQVIDVVADAHVVGPL